MTCVSSPEIAARLRGSRQQLFGRPLPARLGLAVQMRGRARHQATAGPAPDRPRSALPLRVCRQPGDREAMFGERAGARRRNSRGSPLQARGFTSRPPVGSWRPLVAEPCRPAPPFRRGRQRVPCRSQLCQKRSRGLLSFAWKSLSERVRPVSYSARFLRPVAHVPPCAEDRSAASTKRQARAHRLRVPQSGVCAIGVVVCRIAPAKSR